MRFFLLSLCASALLLSGCASLGDILKGMEPIVDAGVQFAANSAGEAVKEQMGGKWGGPEIAVATTTAIIGVAAAVKGVMLAWNRQPKTP